MERARFSGSFLLRLDTLSREVDKAGFSTSCFRLTTWFLANFPYKIRRRNLVKFDDAENNFVKIYIYSSPVNATGFGIQDVSLGNSSTTFELS